MGSRGKAPCGVSGAKPLTTSVSNESRGRSCFAEQNMFLRFVPKRFFSIMVRARRAKGFAGSARTRPVFAAATVGALFVRHWRTAPF